MDPGRLACALNVESAGACARLAEGLAWKGFDEFFLPGSAKTCTTHELHVRAKKLHDAWAAKAKENGLQPLRIAARLTKQNTGSLSYARLLIERVEAFAWAAGMTRSFPPHDSRVEVGFSSALRVVMSGGVAPSSIRPRREAEVRKVRTQVAAWWWRTRAEEYRVRSSSFAPEVKKAGMKAVKLRGEFTKLVAARRRVKMCGSDFQLSEGGPFFHNYFPALAMELDDLHRPRYMALAWAETGTEPDPTLAWLWEEATGTACDEKGWTDVSV